MFNKIILLLLLVCSAGAWHHYNTPSPAPLPPTPRIVVQPTPDPVVVEPVLPKNQETAPVEQPKPQVIVQPKKEKAPIRYDKNVERPSGYYDYCDKYSTRAECGGRK